MALSSGRRLGPYEIISLLGAGGMGEVYRVRDHKLQRDVAVKVLPARLAEDAAALARFEREAQAVAALSHPNILAIHDFGREGDTAYAVTELLEGETLGARLESGALPPRKIVEYAVQIARGLAAAHDKGVVHRDLKPDNLFVTRDGQVKILDFGLARASAPRVTGSMMDSPTLTGLTDPGAIVGTASYMSPEQVKGQPADHRSDIFSFGAVLYEMATGRRAFRRDSAAETMAAILREDPPELKEGDPAVPPGLARIVRRCLEKDREARFQSARDIAFDFEDLSSAASAAFPAPVPGKRSARLGWPTLAGAVVIAVGAASFVAGRRSASRQGAPLVTVRFSQLTDLPGAETSPRLSPDGRMLLFVSRALGNADIYLQRVGGHNPINITGDCPKDDSAPAFSPDGERIAFRSECEGGGIFVMGATGESRNRVTDFGHDPSWSPDGKRLVVATEQTLNPLNRITTSALWIVDAATGEKRALTSGDAMQPAWSPHGHRIAYWGVRGRSGQRDIWTLSTEPGATPVEVTNDGAADWDPVWSPDGRYLYFSSGRGGAMNLWRVPIDEGSGRVLAPPEPLTVPALWSGGLSIARDGRHFVYATAEPRSNIQRIAFDPVKGALLGAPTPIVGGSRSMTFHSPSPDGQWIAFTSGGLRENLFVVRMDGTGYRQLTDDEFRNRGPDWSPDGQRIAFYSDRSGRYQVWTIRPDGSGLEQVTDVSQDVGVLTVPHWSPDGLRLVTNGPPTLLFDLRRPMKDREMRTLPPIAEDVMFSGAEWSPDGSRLAGWCVRKDGSTGDIMIYSVATDSYKRAGNPGLGPVWLNDGRRLLYPTLEGALVLLDLPSGASRELLPRGTVAAAFNWPCRITRDNRILTFRHDTYEGDVWLMTLE